VVHVFCNNAQSFVSCCGTDGDSSVKDLICMLTYNRMTGRCDGGGVTGGLDEWISKEAGSCKSEMTG
jgi:hypothetical protein